MHQTAYHRCNRVFYPPMNEDIPGKLFFDLIIFAVFLHYTYFWSSLQHRVIDWRSALSLLFKGLIFMRLLLLV